MGGGEVGGWAAQGDGDGGKRRVGEKQGCRCSAYSADARVWHVPRSADQLTCQLCTAGKWATWQMVRRWVAGSPVREACDKLRRAGDREVRSLWPVWEGCDAHVPECGLAGLAQLLDSR